MRKVAAWFAGYSNDLESNFDSEAMSFRNQKHSAIRFIVGVLIVFVVGVVVGKL